MFGSWRNTQRIKQSQYSDVLLGNKVKDEWICIDCEMTGLNPRHDFLLSVAAIPIKGQRILTGQAGYWICRPPIMPTAETICIHGLRPEDVETGISYATLFDELLPMIATRPIVGYHTPLDKGFLDSHCRQILGFTPPNRCLDIATLFAQYEQQRNGQPCSNLKFTHILDSLGVPTLPAHNAFNDALMTAMAFQMLKRS
ncbi:3'-5' exonuclease [Cardiobacteriaceae bacterium TAE3-ERU3]|nr:3'-5' exonuclease [Cardiobacteriaceae bacterium TAE3-ERU3]